VLPGRGRFLPDGAERCATIRRKAPSKSARQHQHPKASNAARDFDLAKKHLEAHRQLEADARARVKALRPK